MTGKTNRDIPVRSFHKIQQKKEPPHSALFHNLSLFFPFPNGKSYLLPIPIPNIRFRVAGSQELVTRVAPSLIPLPASQTVNALQERAGKLTQPSSRQEEGVERAAKQAQKLPEEKPIFSDELFRSWPFNRSIPARSKKHCAIKHWRATRAQEFRRRFRYRPGEQLCPIYYPRFETTNTCAPSTAQLSPHSKSAIDYCGELRKWS